LLNSWQGLFTATAVRQASLAFHRHSFSRSYGVILPSSLTRVLPFPLVSSTCLPVSVCGTDAYASSLSGFSRQLGSVTSGSYGPPSRLALPNRASLVCSSHFSLGTSIHSEADLPNCVPASLHLNGSGILTGCPSPTPSGLGLGPTNPTWTDLPSESLGFRGTRFSRVSRYSCQHSRFCQPHSSFRYCLSL
jgi:hypothetical protein